MNNFLILELIKGSPSSFKQVYELYHYKVFCFVKKYTDQLADAEDVTQNVFIHLWNYRSKLNPDTELDAVLFKTAKQEISKWYTKQNKVFSVNNEQLTTQLDQPEEPVEENFLDSDVELNKLRSLLNTIPEKRKRIFILHKFEGWSHKEIATEMNMSTTAVANQIFMVMQFLKKHIGKNMDLLVLAILFL